MINLTKYFIWFINLISRFSFVLTSYHNINIHVCINLEQQNFFIKDRTNNKFSLNLMTVLVQI